MERIFDNGPYSFSDSRGHLVSPKQLKRDDYFRVLYEAGYGPWKRVLGVGSEGGHQYLDYTPVPLFDRTEVSGYVNSHAGLQETRRVFEGYMARVLGQDPEQCPYLTRSGLHTASWMRGYQMAATDLLRAPEEGSS